MRAIHRLALLNEADLALDAAKARLAEIGRALQEPAALSAARAALAQAEKELERCRREQQKLEQAQAEAKAEVTRTEQKLYSGQIRNPRELENAERDLQQHRHQQAAVEDRLLEAMMATDAAAERYAACQAELARLTATWEETQAALRQEQAQLKARLQALQARQAAARQAAPPELLPLYDSLRARKAGRAVAAVDGDTCAACSVAVPPSQLTAALEGDEPVFCSNCGRLLWAE